MGYKGIWGCVKLTIGHFKVMVGMCETEYGILRGRNKGREGDSSRWIEEEQAWENRRKEGIEAS